ncbi:hypothetical protein [Parasitella parasitica]|uniref:enoyl-[acyl-carrier-protein] reductase n=1 Tax=Parasitella parasitica TaxID=35722 RepID=A0A0B7N9C2_9FUNG|nr:hypothetical protein [Parasitella parasitica]
MTILLRSILKTHQQIRPVASARWVALRGYSGKSDITASAMVYSDYGQPSQVLRWHSYLLPALTSDTVHVKFLASPINPADVNMIQGAYPIKPTFHQLGDENLAVGGNEGVAEVIATGDGVDSLKVGDQVVMANTGYGTWRTHAAGPASDFQLLPYAADNVSNIQKATITVNPCTAYRMLKDFVDLKQGDYIIQNGGNSAVGQAVIQIAKAWGLKTINVVRNRPNLDQLVDELTQLGATHVITDESLGRAESKKEIKSWFGKNAPLLGLNCVGGQSATEMARYLGSNGHFVTYGAMSRKPLSLPASLLIFKNISFHGFWVSKWAETHSKQERYAMLEDILGLMSQNKLLEPKWTQVEWNEEAMKQAVDQGISGFATEYIAKMNVVAPCPLKPSGTGRYRRIDYCWSSFHDEINLDDVQDACMEIQQILQSDQHHQSQQQQYIARTGNPLVQDSSFIPLHQAVSQLQVSNTSEIKRPRSFSVGDPPRSHHHMMQPSTLHCKPIF